MLSGYCRIFERAGAKYRMLLPPDQVLDMEVYMGEGQVVVAHIHFTSIIVDEVRNIHLDVVDFRNHLLIAPRSC